MTREELIARIRLLEINLRSSNYWEHKINEEQIRQLLRDVVDECEKNPKRRKEIGL